jgi:hypothetical protein
LLRGQDPVQGFKRKPAPPAQEIGEMRLAQTRLPREQGNAERATLYAAQHLQAQSFVHLGEIHLWIIRHGQ